MAAPSSTVKRAALAEGRADDDWTSAVPVNQIPAVIAQLASVQSRLVERWLSARDDRLGSDDRPSESLLSMTEVAGTLGVPVAYARELGRRGELPVVRVGPKYVRVRRSVLDAWIAQREDRPRGRR